MQKIQITIRNVYGNETAYPVCRQAKLFAELAGHATLTQRDLMLIDSLGYEVEVVANTGKLVIPQRNAA